MINGSKMRGSVHCSLEYGLWSQAACDQIQVLPPAVWPCKNYLTFLCLSILIYK